MEFVTIRRSAAEARDVWEQLRQQREIILTSNVWPVAVIAGGGDGRKPTLCVGKGENWELDILSYDCVTLTRPGQNKNAGIVPGAVPVTSTAPWSASPCGR